MKLDPEALLHLPTANVGNAHSEKKLPFLLLTAALVWLFGWYWTTATSIEAIWASNGTFQHGYLIVPISFALIWRRRNQLLQLPLKPVFWPIIWLMALGFVWLLGDLGQAAVVRQYALVLMVPTIVVMLFGARFAQ